MINKHNPGYSGGIPIAAGDRYHGQDLFRDFFYLLEKSGLTIEDILSAVPFLASGGYVTKGTGWDEVDITAAIGYHEYDVTVPDSFVALPPTTKTETLRAQRVESTAQTDFDISGATLNGSTVNYLKLEYAETNGNSRTRAKKAGSYNYELVDSFLITANSTPATDKQVTLCTFVGDGSTFLTITNIEPVNLSKLFLDNIFQDDRRTAIIQPSNTILFEFSSYNLANSNNVLPTHILNVNVLTSDDSNAKFTNRNFVHLDDGNIIYPYTWENEGAYLFRIKPNWAYDIASNVFMIDSRSKTVSSTDRILLYYAAGTDKITFRVDDNASDNIIVESDVFVSTVTLNVWLDIMIAWSKSTNSVDMYINGVQQGGGVEGTKTTNGNGISSINMATTELSIGSERDVSPAFDTTINAYLTDMLIRPAYYNTTTNHDGTASVKPYYNENRIAGINHNNIFDIYGNHAARTYSCGFINSGGGFEKTIRMPIGPWDMDTVNSITGISLPSDLSIDNITFDEVRVISDSGSHSYHLDMHTSGGVQGGSYHFSIGPTISLYRLIGGFFDSTSYNDATINRGWITIRYLVI